MASPASSASLNSAVSSLKQKANDLKSKADEMAKRASILAQSMNVNSELNIGGALASKLGGIQAISILTDAVPGKILPQLTGAAGTALIAAYVANLLKKAKSVGNKKTGQPTDENEDEAQKAEKKKQEAIAKAEETRNKKLEAKKKAAQPVVAKK